jgi:adenylosuccinate synthase
VTEIVAVFRTFPIRVAGLQAGPLKDEIDWETIQRESGYATPIHEFTTVTQKMRRVGRFEWELARHTIQRNRPTRVALMGLDCLDYADLRKTHLETLGQKSREFIRRFETEISRIDYFGTGPGLEDTIPRGIPSVASREKEIAA